MFMSAVLKSPVLAAIIGYLDTMRSGMWEFSFELELSSSSSLNWFASY